MTGPLLNGEDPWIEIYELQTMPHICGMYLQALIDRNILC